MIFWVCFNSWTLGIFRRFHGVSPACTTWFCSLRLQSIAFNASRNKPRACYRPFYIRPEVFQVNPYAIWMSLRFFGQSFRTDCKFGCFHSLRKVMAASNLYRITEYFKNQKSRQKFGVEVRIRNRFCIAKLWRTTALESLHKSYQTFWLLFETPAFRHGYVGGGDCRTFSRKIISNFFPLWVLDHIWAPVFNAITFAPAST